MFSHSRISENIESLGARKSAVVCIYSFWSGLAATVFVTNRGL